MPLDYEQVVNRRHVRAARSRSPSVTRRDSFRRRMSAMEDQIVNVVASAYGPAQQVSRSASMQNLGWGCNYEPLPPSSMARSSSYAPSGGRLRRTQSLSLRPDERPPMGGGAGRTHLSVFRTQQQQTPPLKIINSNSKNKILPPPQTAIIPDTLTAVDHCQHQNNPIAAAVEELHPEDPHQPQHRSSQYEHHQSQQQERLQEQQEGQRRPQEQQERPRLQELAEAERQRQMEAAAYYHHQQQQLKTTPAVQQEQQAPAEPTQQQQPVLVPQPVSSNRMTPTRREQMQSLLQQTEAEHDPLLQRQGHRFDHNDSFHRENNAPNLLTSEREAFAGGAAGGGKQNNDETFLRSGSGIEDQPLRKYDVYSMRTWSYPIWKHLNGRTQFSQFYGGVSQYTPPLMTSDHSSRAYSGYAPLAGEHSYITTTEASYHPYSSPYRRFHSRPSESPWYRDYLGQMGLRHFGGYRPRYANFTARPIWASR